MYVCMFVDLNHGFVRRVNIAVCPNQFWGVEYRRAHQAKNLAKKKKNVIL